LNKEEQTIDETTEVADTDTTDDPSVEERSDDTKNASGTDTKTEPSDADSSPDENRDDSQAEPDPGETVTTEPQPSRSEPDAEYMSILTSVDQHLLKLEELFTGQIARNQNQKQMFDAVYREMTSYKENALLEAFHKPIIHNLIRFYDNLVLVESQLDGIGKPFEALGSQIEGIGETFEALGTWFGSLAEKERNKFFASDKELTAKLEEFKNKLSPSEENAELKDEQPLSQANTELKDKLSQFQANLENVRFELEEVLYRMDVIPNEEHPEKLDRKLHKTLNTILTDDPDKDRGVAEIHKTGFYWREKVFRPEEITIFRYTPSAGEPERTADEETIGENPTDEKGDETDG
jgi:molecular chaperone GrpE (heat shock protein)